MRKLVSLLLSIGILSGAFIGCGTNTQKEVSDNENSSNISNEEKNNKEEVKNDNKESKDSENDTKAKKEEKSSENEEVVTVKDGVITIPKGFKIAEITFDYNRKNIVELNEVENYSDLDKENILGAIIGKNPLGVGNIDGDWNYNTFIMYGFSLRYPNFFEIQKSEMPDLECGITLKSKDKKIEFSAGLNDNHDGKTAKDELDIENKCNEKDSKILISNLEGNTYTFACEKNGLIIYEYGIVEGPDSDIPVFIYRYPAKYKDTFDKIIEESKKSFVPTKGFPREVNNNSNKGNNKESNKSQSKDNTQTIDIKEYGLTPDEAIKLFYKNDPKGLKTQNEVDRFLTQNYGETGLELFMKYQSEVFEYIKNVNTYLSKPEKDIYPVFFIENRPIYSLGGWADIRREMYVDSEGKVESTDNIKMDFENGDLYRIKDGKRVKVINKPFIGNDGCVVFED
ncbi:hypothetical protein [Clostridium perfringens]|uniref:hypothetical protein n=1 Tax=Clostridium perfringens TaxID=1502 RepID=UPI0039EBFEB3